MTKHTPGPWSARNGRIFMTDREELTVANVARAFDGDYSPANARLIAAAPDLLEALEALADLHKPCLADNPTLMECVKEQPEYQAYYAARAAIAKAKGAA